MNSQYKGKNYDNPEISNFCTEVKNGGSLSTILTADNIFLPDGYAFKISQELGELNTSQLRKFFDMIKAVETIYEERFNDARNELYRIVPLAAYAVGRKTCPKAFYNILEVCINAKKLQQPKDIKTFIDFIETIVAYSKFNNKK